MIESTCKKEKCPFFLEHGTQCPFLVETWWHTDSGDKKLVEDCAPVRSMLMQQEYYNRAVALQKSHEEARNELHNTNTQLEMTIQQTKNFMLEADKQMYEIRKLQRTHNRWLAEDERKKAPRKKIEVQEDYEL